MVTTTKFKRADYMALPEGFPAQLIDGELVKDPAPTYGHQRLVLDLAAMLRELVGRDRVVISPIDVFLDDENVFQPDVLVTPAPLRRDAADVGIPCLVIEVLSPSTRHLDRRRKLGSYLEAGIEEVWIVDPDSGTVEIHTVGGETVGRGRDEVASRIVPGFRVVPDVLFGVTDG